MISRGGSWNKVFTFGNPVPTREASQKIVLNEKEVSVFKILKLPHSGNGMILVWTTQTSTQKVVSTGAKDPRKNYAFCGVNSICNYDGNVATCEYLRGFVPSSPGPWNIEVSSDGCVSKNKSNYSNSYTDSFFKYTNLKLPDIISSWFNKTLSLMNRKEDVDLPTFGLSVLANASENFSNKSKLGEGNPDRWESFMCEKSGQGLEEFKNAMALISKLQHCNLVKLLGFCIEGEEKMLIYEYMPNHSLDYFVFDLKTDNILLDANLDPKISDFGLAGSFLGDQVEANTNRVAGTYGYMPLRCDTTRDCKWEEKQIFWTRSTTIIFLDILWTEERALEMLDELLEEQCSPSEVIRCIQIGLLCVQQRPKDRPDMSSVNGDKLMPKPKVPGFYPETEVTSVANCSLENHRLCSVNELSIRILAAGQSIRDGETLVSAGGITKVGFFSPGNSTRRYLGIWYTNVSPITVVWVANRNSPLENNSGVLKLNEKGILELLNGKNSTIWSSNISSKAVNYPIAQLLDSGNFVVKYGQEITNEDSVLWQSFDYPCDSLMPGMKLGWNLETGLERYLSSWRSVDDPALGEYTVKIDLRGYPQIIKFKGPDIISRAGSWNGLSTVGNPGSTRSQKMVINEKEVYFEFELPDRSEFGISSLTPSGTSLILYWTTQRSTRQAVLSNADKDQCGSYAFCGANSICIYDGNVPTCECLRGYAPKHPDQWNIAIWSDGCVPRNKSNCTNSYTDGFLKYTNMKLPDTSSSWFSKTMNLDECQKSCLKNCSCTAYANLDIRDGGSGCLLWFNTLVDLRNFSELGQDFYIRLSASELDHGGQRKINKKIVAIAVGVTIFGLIITCVCILVIKNPGAARKIYNKNYRNILRKEDIDLPTFSFSVLANATENFSTKNKLGEGGYGPVYKGKLLDGKELAVKRLSKKSGQGLEEFKNEVALISKLQHRNLVKLLGCCIEGEEKILIYEYMPNHSLDYFVFDESKRKLLDWDKRFDIISGIARGLLYLHQDSRLRIIHRDLKTSNILLDENLDPKISDFGLARSFLGDQVEANTNRVAGTYGYMPPEYAARGHFSVKSDVFSYGVIVLEIVTGKKNREFSDPECYNNLLGHAWRLWTEEMALELLDEVLGEQCTPSEVIRCVQVGLLCVQQRPQDRPNMSSVVLMLNGEKLLPKPKVPGFYTEAEVTSEANNSLGNPRLCSVNELSITIFLRMDKSDFVKYSDPLKHCGVSNKQQR
ncbi:G-type lectin S-receptor-like serine/threonine-protein kinase [Glycine max]|nr:G-type lectin S-receptor-like serine/threonine-protein kinase [Glycine max]